MQSWGHQARFNRRTTASAPTKSGVLGMIAAAEGRHRTDSLADLLELRFAVRVDQPGTLLRDYQSAQTWQRRTKTDTSLVTRYFLQDAVFLAALESKDREVLEGMEEALLSPMFPLYLGRRSCPANPDLVKGIVDTDAVVALQQAKWCAGKPYKKRCAQSVSLPVYRDALPGEPGEQIQDVPVSFDQEHRKYAWRTVVEESPVEVENSEGTRPRDPFFEAVVQA